MLCLYLYIYYSFKIYEINTNTIPIPKPIYQKATNNLNISNLKKLYIFTTNVITFFKKKLIIFDNIVILIQISGKKKKHCAYGNVPEESAVKCFNWLIATLIFRSLNMDAIKPQNIAKK